MSKLSRAEAWNRVHKASTSINFTSFDFATVKQSLIDYFKLYHPEFNNWIETDEFVMVIEAFAYVCELLSYRIDMIGNETFLTTAQRKDSVLKLVKFISYKPSRIKPGIGLVKINSVMTTEQVYDVSGNNLANIKVIWNDPNNINWKHQFLTIINATIVESLGNVKPKDRKQIYDQMFELYTFNNIPLSNGVIGYNASTQYKSVPMELVSCDLNENGPYEQRPASGNKFNFLYGTDGLGDNSKNTGFFILTKQGSLNVFKRNISETVLHNTIDVLVDNINNIDVWVNEIHDGNTIFWSEVDTIHSQNVIFTDSTDFNRYEIETLTNDNIRIHFGDGIYANIPFGDFDVWYRVSDPEATIIPYSSVDNLKTNLSYTDAFNKTQNLIIEFSLVSDIQNSSPSEDIEHMRNNAPAVYYTQNRMVTGHDYNNFLLQDNSILKLSAINRTYAGHSKFTQFNDASDTYQNINHFSDDLSVYVDESIRTITVPSSYNAVAVVNNYIQPILSDSEFLSFCSLNSKSLRRYFTESEIRSIVYDFMGSVYYITDNNPKNPVFPFAIYIDTKFVPMRPTTSDWVIHVDRKNEEFIIQYKAANIVAHSPSTNFWTTKSDKIVLLKNNFGNCRFKDNNTMLSQSITMPVIGPKKFYDPKLLGTIDTNSVVVTLPDNNNDGLPDFELLNSFINNTKTINVDFNKDFISKKYDPLFDHSFGVSFDTDVVPFSSIELHKPILVRDISVTGNIDNTITYIEQDNEITDRITIDDPGNNSVVTITINDYVYFKRLSIDTPYYVDNNAVYDWLIEDDINSHTYTIRKKGRSDLNFLWQHLSTVDTRINPSTSNIIDCFVITRGYYYATQQWLSGQLSFKPKAPSTSELMTSYSKLIAHKMISDELILKSGEFKILFGKYAPDELKAKFVIVRNKTATLTDIQIKSFVVDTVYKFFDINLWNFGDTFNFTELSAFIHNSLLDNIESCVLVPVDYTHKFGTLYQITAMENEIFIPCVSVDDVIIHSELSPSIINI